MGQNSCVADGFESEGWVRMGVAAALAKEYASDQARFLVLLVKSLEESFPQETRVLRKGFLTKTIVGAEIDLADLRYRIEDQGHGRLTATRAKIVRGINLKTEELPVSKWLQEIAEALELRAKTNQENRSALARMLGLS